MKIPYRNKYKENIWNVELNIRKFNADKLINCSINIWVKS